MTLNDHCTKDVAARDTTYSAALRAPPRRFSPHSHLESCDLKSSFDGNFQGNFSQAFQTMAPVMIITSALFHTFGHVMTRIIKIGLYDLQDYLPGFRTEEASWMGGEGCHKPTSPQYYYDLHD